jgi:hypothetical protein
MADTEFAKTHLREHLGSLLVSPVSEGFWSIQKTAIEFCERNSQPDQVLRTFQNMLTRIHEWSDVTLSTEVDRIQKVSKCGYLDDLLMGVFIAYMKSFATLHYRGGSTEINIDFDRPSLAKFIHELYKHSARKLWQVAYLFKTTGITSEQHARNRQEVESIISQCLEQVIRSFLPWESIAKKYFSQSEPTTQAPPPEEASDSSESEEEEAPAKGVSFEDDEEEEADINDLLGIQEEEAPPAEEEEKDPLKELEEKVEESLVLNL